MTSWLHRIKSTTSVVVVITGMIVGGQISNHGSAYAQSNEVLILQQQIQSLRQSIKDLQLKVFKGVTPENLELVMEKPGADQTKMQLAQMKSQILAFEETLRDLNGQYEVLDNRANRLETRLDKLIEDIDFRLSSIEDRLANAPQGPVAQNTTPLATTQDAINNSAAVTTQPIANGPTGTVPQTSIVTTTPTVVQQQPTNTLAAGQQVLGTISEKKLEAFEAGKPVQPLSQNGATDTKIVLGTTGAENANANIASSNTGNQQQATASQGATLTQFSTPEEEYKAAYKFLQLHDWTGAELAMQQFLDKHPEHVLSENAMYWLGETYYARKLYSEAMSVFAAVYQKNEKGRKAPDSLLKLGMSLAQLQQKEQACVTFEILMSEHEKANPLILKRAKQQHKAQSCPPIQ